MSRVAGLVLAAGAGRRLGTPKALLRLDGRTLLEHAIAVLDDAGCEPVIAVLGAAAQEVGKTSDLASTIVVINEDWPTGMGSSLGHGLRAAASTGADAVAVILVDLPGLTIAAVELLIASASAGALAVATYGGKRGHPVVLGRNHWAGIIAAAAGDVGARAYLRDHADEVREVPCDGVAEPDDVDTPEAARRWGIAS